MTIIPPSGNTPPSGNPPSKNMSFFGYVKSMFSSSAVPKKVLDTAFTSSKKMSDFVAIITRQSFVGAFILFSWKHAKESGITISGAYSLTAAIAVSGFFILMTFDIYTMVFFYLMQYVSKPSSKILRTIAFFIVAWIYISVYLVLQSVIFELAAATRFGAQ